MKSAALGRVALVSGGSRGIGRAISLQLAAEGADTVFVNYLQNDVEAEKTRELVEQHDCQAHLVRANLAYPNQIGQLFDQIEQTVDHLDVFIHCAALTSMKPTLALRPNQWDLTMNASTRSFLLCVKRCVPLMREGAIVALSSLGGGRVIPNYGAMGIAKAALESTVRYLAAELAPKGIRVNAISGGLIDTESIRNFPDSETLIEETVKRTPAGRIGQPEDIADIAMFLISSESRWICGQTLVADGGLSLS
ncbi:MAG: SDR family oxidoreductase [Chromatiales bacterium]|nr:MAG: SDR family oxidoreductase [Chromatiales bacterium]